MRRFKIIVFGVVVISGVGFTAHAIERSTDRTTDTTVTVVQADPDTSRQQKEMSDMPMRPGPAGKRGEFGHGPGKFERLRMKKLMQLLELEGEQKDAFVAIAEKYRDRRMEHMRSHMATVDSLASGIRSGSLDAKGIDRLVERLDQLESEQAKMKAGFREEVRPLLDAGQYGKLVVFEYRFEARILDRLKNFRRRGDGPPPGRPPGPPENMDSFLDNDSI